MKNSIVVLLMLFSQLSLAGKVTVSGISSGAYMAQQFHTAFSSQVSGVGIVAGGPYYCSRGLALNAINLCMDTYWGIPSAKWSVDVANELARINRIDSVANIATAKVYVLSGTEDETVRQSVSGVLVETYRKFGVPAKNIIFDNKMRVGHAFPTENYGNSCATPSKSPYIANCGRDTAGDILNHLIGKLKPKVRALDERIFSFNQLAHFDGLSVSRLSMQKTGFVYIPKACGKGATCKVHVAFHGCKQTLDDIQTTFVKEAGYNGWAEANKLIILYPQAKTSYLLSNPNGCWDWWGYTSVDFHTRDGYQMRLVARLIEALQNKNLELTKFRP